MPQIFSALELTMLKKDYQKAQRIAVKQNQSLLSWEAYLSQMARMKACNVAAFNKLIHETQDKVA